ncbi:MAG: putative CRISPR-associated protein [Okeania sp. SIO2D1]|nr:putative CRISPR-associated protein [Okeania sp. SIO2D1]
MARLVISTVGTSLLTNQIKNSEKRLNSRLQDTTNLTQDEIGEDVKDIISQLLTRAEKILNRGDTLEIQEASAELNGIYELYDKNLEAGKEDIHWLIATNTAQGRATAKIVREFLVKQGITNTKIFPESDSKFSTKNTDVFSQGIAEIIRWMENLKEKYQSQIKIVFNLVGGFKAIQGYMNTIGMFYADEIIYIFEGSNKLIKIPRLPVEIKLSEVEKYKLPLAMMSERKRMLTSWKEAQEIPKDWVDVTEKEMTLSAWGELIYQQSKNKLLSQDEPLKFPKIEYKQSFLDDYQDKPADEKIILQENLARLACLLNINKDGISAVKQDAIIHLRRYIGKYKDLDHFDLPKDRRVSCLVLGNTLQLRHYGEHDYVNNNP